MTWIERLTPIAENLVSEATRRHRRAKLNLEDVLFYEQDGVVRFEGLKPFDNHEGHSFAALSFYPRKRSVLLKIFPDIKKEARVVVYFGNYHPEHKVKNNLRKWRSGIRSWQRTSAKPTFTMVIDEKTSSREIVEQLAIFLMQINVGDASTEKTLGFTTNSSDVKRQATSLLVNQFTDPLRPASYRALKKRLKQAAMGEEYAQFGAKGQLSVSGNLSDEEDGFRGQTWRDNRDVLPGCEDDDRISDFEQTRLEGINDAIRKTKARHTGVSEKQSFSVSEAARYLRISRRSLYEKCAKGVIPTDNDRFGRITINVAELKRLQANLSEKAARIRRVEAAASERGIKMASALRADQRARRKEKVLPD